MEKGTQTRREWLIRTVVDKLLLGAVLGLALVVANYWTADELGKNSAFYTARSAQVAELWSSVYTYGVDVASATESGDWGGVEESIEGLELNLAASGIFLGLERTQELHSRLLDPIAECVERGGMPGPGEKMKFLEGWRECLDVLGRAVSSGSPP